MTVGDVAGNGAVVGIVVLYLAILGQMIWSRLRAYSEDP